MTQNQKKLSARHATLTASVAGVSLAILLAGPSAFRTASTPGWTGSAIAAERMLQPTGFADVVAKGEAGSERVHRVAPEPRQSRNNARLARARRWSRLRSADGTFSSRLLDAELGVAPRAAFTSAPN